MMMFVGFCIYCVIRLNFQLFCAFISGNYIDFSGLTYDIFSINYRFKLSMGSIQLQFCYF